MTPPAFLAAWLAAGLALGSATAAAQGDWVVSPVDAARAEPGLRLGPGTLEVLEDPSRALNLGDVRGAHRSGFHAVDGERPSFGVTRSVHWLRFRVGPSAAPLWLDVGNQLVGAIAVHRVAADGSVATTLTGAASPLATRERNHPRFLFRVPAGGGTEVYIRISDGNGERIPLSLWGEDAFARHDRVRALLDGAFYGGLALALVFQIMLVSAVRDRGHLAFVFAVLFAAVYFPALDGIGPAYLWPGVAQWTPRSRPGPGWPARSASPCSRWGSWASTSAVPQWPGPCSPARR